MRVQANLEIELGKRYHQQAMQAESLDMDAVYNALDTFSRASLLASGVDTELEAIAEAWLGKIQYKLLS